MPKITATSGEDFTVLPQDMIVTVKCNNTKVEEVPTRDGGTWDKLDFEFTIEHVANEDYADAVGQRIWGGVGFRLTDHPDNRLRQWVEALLGIEISEGFELDTDMLHGRTARAIIENYPRKNGGNGHKVGALLPLTSGQETAAAQALGMTQGSAPQQSTDPDVPF